MRFLMLILLNVLLTLSTQGQSTFAYDFETARTLPKFTAFGTTFELHENPKENRVNSSLLVGRVHKVPGESVGWSGIATKAPWHVNLKNGGQLKMKVLATTQKGKVQIKFQDDNNEIRAYSSAYISKLNEWQELTFRFKKNIDREFSRLVITFDVGSVEPHIYYFDDVKWVAGEGKPN